MKTDILLALFQQPPEHIEMTGGGWVFMALAWLLILSLVSFTFSRVLGKRG